MRAPIFDVLGGLRALSLEPSARDGITWEAPCPRCGKDVFTATDSAPDWVALWCPHGWSGGDMETTLRRARPDGAHATPMSVFGPRRGPWISANDVASQPTAGEQHLRLVADDVEPVDGAELLDELVAFVCRYVVLTPAQVSVLALWIVHTHAIDAADTTPYVSITSAEKESGKTQTLETLEHLVARPWLTGRVSAAVLVRKVDAVQPTLLLDESDAAFGGEKEYAEALRGLLNTGYRQSGKASLCVGQGAGLTYKDFSTFCPKAIAGIGELPDTVASRSIPLRLRRRRPDESVERFRRREVEADAASLRERAATFADAHLEQLEPARPALPDELGDRAQDVVEPLLAIADAAGGEWPTLAREAFVELLRLQQVDDESMGVRLLADVRAIFETGGADRVSTADLLAELVALDEAPWASGTASR